MLKTVLYANKIYLSIHQSATERSTKIRGCKPNSPKRASRLHNFLKKISRLFSQRALSFHPGGGTKAINLENFTVSDFCFKAMIHRPTHLYRNRGDAHHLLSRRNNQTYVEHLVG